MKPITFLVVEDDDVDLMSIKRVLRRLRVRNPVAHARDGMFALEMLHGKKADIPGHPPIEPTLEPPYLILLDLNMPRLNGLEFLQAIRKDPRTATTAVFVLTTSETDQDILGAHAHDINGYIFKSDLEESLGEALDGLELDRVLLA